MFVFACRGPYVFVNYGIGVIIYESLLTVFVISNFGLATFMDPGMYPQGLPVLTLNIKKKIENLLIQNYDFYDDSISAKTVTLMSMHKIVIPLSQAAQ